MPLDVIRMRRVRLLQDVRGDWPIGHTTIAPAGEYIAELNPQGAAAVRAQNGELLGIKPGEFEFLDEEGA